VHFTKFGLSAFTGTDMSSSVSSSHSDDSLKGGNANDPPSSTRFLQYKVVLQHVGDDALQLYLEKRPLFPSVHLVVIQDVLMVNLVSAHTLELT
jgi:hypothetical protein